MSATGMGFGATCNGDIREFQVAMQGVPTKNSALDESIAMIGEELYRYRDNLNGLIVRLEAPRPANDSCGSTIKERPLTVGQALQEIYSGLVNCNEILIAVNRRIDEQVGDLKLLP